MAKTKDIVLLVDGEPKAQEALSGLLGAHITIERARDREQALEMVAQTEYAAVIGDFAVAGPEGGQGLKRALTSGAGGRNGDTEALLKLKSVLEAARKSSQDRVPSLDQLLTEARSTHTTLVEMLHGQIKDLLNANAALTQQVAERDAGLEDLGRKLDAAGRERAQAQGEAAAAQQALDAAFREAEAVRERLAGVQTEKSLLEASLAEAKASFAKEREEFDRRSHDLQSQMDAAQNRTAAMAKENKEVLARLQTLEGRVKQQAEESSRQIAVLDAQLREAKAAKDQAVADKKQIEGKLAEFQEHWERLLQSRGEA